VKEMTTLDRAARDYTRKSREAFRKWETLREDFRDKQERIRADLEEASKTWVKLSKRFKWWQSLP
jgi:predicted nucleotide-binding protein (sugar kinase/HSP70/actin superfamily)